MRKLSQHLRRKEIKVYCWEARDYKVAEDGSTKSGEESHADKVKRTLSNELLRAEQVTVRYPQMHTVAFQ